jgi:hypothetical protein
MTPDLINLIVTVGIGSVITLWQQKNKDLHEERMANRKELELYQKQAKEARDHKAHWKGFYWVRAAIALIVVSYFFIIPSVALLFFNDVQVVLGFWTTFKGPFMMPDFESITWVKMGYSGEDARILVYDPVRNSIMIAISGLFFGNQFARRS